MSSEEILTCNYCGERIIPPTLGAYLGHLETKHPEMTRDIGTLKRLITIGRKPRSASSTEKCSYCGQEGHSIQNCPKWKKSHGSSDEKDWRTIILRPEYLDKLFRFQHDIDGETFRKLFIEVGGSPNMAEHLWMKFHSDYNHKILDLWISLDSANRVLVLAVINRWSGL